MTCVLSVEDIQKLSRDLQILIATNGTLTRVLGIIGNDEIVIRVVNQEIRWQTSKDCGNSALPERRVLQRRVILQGLNSSVPLVAAESEIIVDAVPPEITENLLETTLPIGEIIVASRLETFKEPADVWMGEVPQWVTHALCRDFGSRTVARCYRIFVGGKPLVVITEYFLHETF